jgi:hypothetical protein
MLLEDVFEPVLEVVECADGRRKGIALLQVNLTRSPLGSLARLEGATMSARRSSSTCHLLVLPSSALGPFWHTRIFA